MKADSIIEDIINAMIDIDQKGGTTNFVARNIDRLPRCDPKDIDPYANLQRLLVMEEKLKIVEEKLNASQADVVYCRVEVDIMKQTVQSHEAVVKNRSPVAPSYADVAEAGCDQNDDENTLVKQMMSNGEFEPVSPNSRAVTYTQPANTNFNSENNRSSDRDQSSMERLNNLTTASLGDGIQSEVSTCAISSQREQAESYTVVAGTPPEGGTVLPARDREYEAAWPPIGSSVDMPQISTDNSNTGAGKNGRSEIAKCISDFNRQCNMFFAEFKYGNSSIRNYLFHRYCNNFYGVQMLPIFDDYELSVYLLA